MIKIKEFISIICDRKNNIVTMVSLDKIYKISNPNFVFIDKLKAQKVTIEDIKENINFINFLKEKKLIIEKQDYPLIEYVNNFYYYEGYCDNPILLNNILKEYHVGIIGCGGIGSVILDQIIALNIRKIKIVDFDIIERKNLNRQFIYKEKDINQEKLIVAKNYLLEKNKNLSIEICKRKVTCEEDLMFFKDVNLIINAADSPHNLNEIALNFCYKNKIDFLTCGVGITNGHIGPFIPFSERKYIFNEEIKNNLQKELKPVKGSLGITNSLISSMMMNEFFKFKATGDCSCLNKIMLINFIDYHINIFDFKIYKEHSCIIKK